jgi:hypothetical protein
MMKMVDILDTNSIEFNCNFFGFPGPETSCVSNNGGNSLLLNMEAKHLDDDCGLNSSGIEMILVVVCNKHTTVHLIPDKCYATMGN